MKMSARALQATIEEAVGDDASPIGIYFSQFGEDVVLWQLLRSIEGGFYVDIGAHHPYRFSNTCLLHRYRKWRGINVDVDERALEAFRRARPGDINVQAAVSQKVERRNLVMFERGGTNTMDRGVAVKSEQIYNVYDRRAVETLSLREILDEHLPEGQHIDLLSIDVEGLDLDVLRGNDWSKYRPSYIAVEARGLDLDLTQLDEDETHKFLTSQGYRIISHVLLTSIYHVADKT
jgi:FkbM family methyltransferase